MKKVADFYVVVSLEKREAQIPCMMRLNESGALLWNKCIESGAVDKNELSAALVEEYGIDGELASADAERFIDSLVKNGLVEYS